MIWEALPAEEKWVEPVRPLSDLCGWAPNPNKRRLLSMSILILMPRSCYLKCTLSSGRVALEYEGIT